MTITCPQCRRDDAIQKVSVVVSSGQYSGSFVAPMTDGWGTMQGRSSTQLSTQLSLPPEPEKKGGIGFWWIASYPLWIFTIGYPIMAISLLVAPIVLILLVIKDIERIPILVGVIGLFVFLFCYILVMVLLFFIGPYPLYKLRKHNKALIKEREAVYIVEKQAWDHAVQNWNRLYFCFRDGVVFDPITNVTFQPDKIHEYIFSL